MIILKIKLHNIRSHLDTEIELKKGINLFTGRTGSGKSSILLAIEYALFGFASGISNSMLMRRGKQSCSIEMDFEENGHTYKIIRGLKRNGKTIVMDMKNIGIFKDGSPLSIIGRASDLNERILEILNYPKDIKPKELFEITSYTKQDEIRALIEMHSERRQEYIDKILQLSKYKNTWDNMKDIISHFSLKLSEINGRIESLRNAEEEKGILEKRISYLEEVVRKTRAELERSKKEYDKISGENSILEGKKDELLKMRRSYDHAIGEISGLERENKELAAKIEGIAEKMKALATPEESESLDYESLVKEQINLKNVIALNKSKISELSSELKNIKNLGEGKCPVCRQPITKAHIESVDEEFKKKKGEIESKILEFEEKLHEINPKIKKAEELKAGEEKRRLLSERLNYYKERLDKNNGVIEDLHSKISSFKFNTSEFQEIEAVLKKKKKVETEIYSNIQSLSREHSLRNEELDEKKREQMKKEEDLQRLEGEKKRAEKLSSAVALLSRMREDIRNIREVVRRNFLEDFRQEFQKKFEEIRKYEDNYSVDVKMDYEPIAYASSGEEVQITSLSGGEKTSVALAYKLALADIAAQISDIYPSEILMLDEPTTGFDQEDIKALPETLRGISTIPQVIIVTHEEELKNAADYKFEVSKEFGKSSIKEIN